MKGTQQRIASVFQMLIESSIQLTNALNSMIRIKTPRGEFNFVSVLFTFMAAGLRNDSELEVASPSNNVEKMERLANSLQDFQSQLQSCSV